MLQRPATLGEPPSVPTFDPNAPQQSEPASADQGGYNLGSRPRYLSDPAREPHADPVGWTLASLLGDILAVLLGTYSGAHRPEQVNISPGSGRAIYTSHTRTHISAIKGSAGSAATRIDITIGAEVVESIYVGAGIPFTYPAALWLDRGQTITAVDGVAGKVDFTCILVASEVD